jgi:hypothetical protein
MLFFTIIISFLLNNHIRIINQKINKLEYTLINHNINISQQLEIMQEIEDLNIEKTIAIIREDLE